MEMTSSGNKPGQGGADPTRNVMWLLLTTASPGWTRLSDQR